MKLTGTTSTNIAVLKNTSFNLGRLIYTFLQVIQISLTFVIPNLAQLGLKTSALTSGAGCCCSWAAFCQPSSGR